MPFYILPGTYQDSNLSTFLPTFVILCHCSFNLTSFSIHLGHTDFFNCYCWSTPLFKYVSFFFTYTGLYCCSTKKTRFLVILQRWPISFCCFIFVCLMVCCCCYCFLFVFSRTLLGTRNVKFTILVLPSESSQFTSRLSHMTK